MKPWGTLIRRTTAFPVFLALLGGLGSRPPAADEKPPILHLQPLIVGPKLTVSQESLALPRNISTVLPPEIALPTEQDDKAAFAAQYLADATVEAELRGPAYASNPLKLHGPPQRQPIDPAHPGGRQVPAGEHPPHARRRDAFPG